LTFRVQGTVRGPELNGKVPPCAAYLRIMRDGVGIIHVRAPFELDDGALLELQATGRYDFGADGFEQAVRGELPDSDLGWCPRFLTANEKYRWLNRTQCLGVGLLQPKKARVDYDLFAMAPKEAP